SVHNKTNMYGLIAGFVEVGETLEEAVQREAFEEVGLKLKNIQYMSSQPWPFPSNLMVAFRAEYESGEIKLQEEEIADAQFFKIDQLP
ncbi:NUDIX domain-containing protein, partial [Acinetobacter sp. 11520]|nr:NUDIX domain-containing protein [Acinetobacter sp. 11520]